MDWILDIILMLLKDKCLSFSLLNFFFEIFYLKIILFLLNIWQNGYDWMLDIKNVNLKSKCLIILFI